MTSGREEFERQLKEMGIEPYQDQTGNHVVFDYVIPGGRLKGTQVKIGFDVPPDFNRTPPGGPHICPRMLPINEQAPSHPERVHVSRVFGPDWQYLSRPFPAGQWKGDKGVADYMAYIDHIFYTT